MEHSSKKMGHSDQSKQTIILTDEERNYAIHMMVRLVMVVKKRICEGIVEEKRIAEEIFREALKD